MSEASKKGNDMSLTDAEVNKILQIIDESGYENVWLEIGNLKIHLQKQDGIAIDPPSPFNLRASDGAAPKIPRATNTVAPAIPEAIRTGEDETVPEGMVAVRAPMLGVFYRAPSPGEKPFVEVGGKVGASDTVCLIEVMKLFNSIKASVDGTIRKLLVENGDMVEHGQLLMLIEPADRNSAVAMK